MATKQKLYPARLDIDYPATLNRLTTFFRLLWAIPIVVILAILTATTSNEQFNDVRNSAMDNSGSVGIVGGLFVATALMILFRRHYPRWWFDFALELTRFSQRVSAYLFLLTDKYPSTTEKQSVHLELDYPDVKNNLKDWMPLVKWLLAVPHYVVLLVLYFIAIFVVIIAWFAILFTGRYPKDLFDYVVGLERWSLRVNAYAFLLITDEYPPFSLKK